MTPDILDMLSGCDNMSYMNKENRTILKHMSTTIVPIRIYSISEILYTATT